jgi:hypothetical protein
MNTTLARQAGETYAEKQDESHRVKVMGKNMTRAT